MVQSNAQFFLKESLNGNMEIQFKLYFYKKNRLSSGAKISVHFS
jgi:hypothetical protein